MNNDPLALQGFAMPIIVRILLWNILGSEVARVYTIWAHGPFGIVAAEAWHITPKNDTGLKVWGYSLRYVSQSHATPSTAWLRNAGFDVLGVEELAHFFGV